MTPIERMAAAYWNAFREGYIAVGGNPASYPTWEQSRDPVKNETLRCMRHAVEEIINSAPLVFDPYGDEVVAHALREMFPEPPQPRIAPKAEHDDKFTTSMKIASMERGPE